MYKCDCVSEAPKNWDPRIYPLPPQTGLFLDLTISLQGLAGWGQVRVGRQQYIFLTAFIAAGVFKQSPQQENKVRNSAIR
jgi:hypothetical protein